MRWIIALIALICLIGGASAQTISTVFPGEGYSSSQLEFFNGQNTVDFQPLVENYWNSYIQNGQTQNTAATTQSNVMGIWLNTFPLTFDKQVELKNSSFVANAPVATNVSGTDMQSAALKRDINYNFNQDQSWKYTSITTTASTTTNENGAPPKSAQGQIISQGIMSLF